MDKEGKFEIIKTDNGYDIAPVIDDKMQPLSYAKILHEWDIVNAGLP